MGKGARTVRWAGVSMTTMTPSPLTRQSVINPLPAFRDSVGSQRQESMVASDYFVKLFMPRAVERRMDLEVAPGASPAGSAAPPLVAVPPLASPRQLPPPQTAPPPLTPLPKPPPLAKAPAPGPAAPPSRYAHEHNQSYIWLHQQK